MDTNRFGDRLEAGWLRSRFVCVGLDPDEQQVGATIGRGDPAETVFRFTQAIVDATHDLVLAYKPNAAFYEQFGPKGMQALQTTIEYIHAVAPEVVVILDAKRGDIEHTNESYARALFDVYDADAATVQPYLGGAALSPFLDRPDRGVIVLCRTSNPEGGEIQDLHVAGVPLYLHIAGVVEESWNRNANCGLLVGATYPAEIVLVRAAAPTLPLLIAGVGRQQGAVAQAVRAAAIDQRGGFVVSASRSVSHAGVGADFADAARQATMDLRQEVDEALGGRSGPS
jgi:orotidine-5'-phosphate decarboxylase